MVYGLRRNSAAAASLIVTAFFLTLAATSSAQTIPLMRIAPPSQVSWLHNPEMRCALLSPDMCLSLFPRESESFPGGPQSTSSTSGSSVHRALVRFGHDQAGIYTGPFKRSNLKWDALFLIGTAALIATDRHTSGALSNEHLNLSRDISDVGLYGTGIAAGAILITGMVTDNPHAKETGFLTAEALLDALPLYAGMQLIAGRERPTEGDGHGRFFQNHALDTAFPSGHVLFAWTMASVIAHEYPRTWVKVLLYTTATAVSVTRFTGREHFISDVAVGSVFGYFIGRYVFHAHCSTQFSEACH
jgi:membrane-associated phospholipid phosphatase